MHFKGGSKIKLFYNIWLSKIDGITYEIYNELIEIFKSKENLFLSTKNKSLFLNVLYLNSYYISHCIFLKLVDDNIKEESKNVFDIIISRKLNYILLEDKNYPKLLKCRSNPIFYLLCNRNINWNQKFVYVFYRKYFSRFASSLVIEFTKAINNFNLYNVIIEKNVKLNNCFNVINESTFFKDYNLIDLENYLILPDSVLLEELISCISIFVIIIEAKYEYQIVSIVNEILNQGKEIYVVPSCISNKNSYFSNYLIKEGANVLLGKNDLKSIL